MASAARSFLVSGALLLLVLGLARGAGGLVLLLRGRDAVDSTRVSEDTSADGYLLFGRPGDRGTIVNIVFAGAILGCLWRGRRAVPPPSPRG